VNQDTSVLTVSLKTASMTARVKDFVTKKRESAFAKRVSKVLTVLLNHVPTNVQAKETVSKELACAQMHSME
jgi:hypothetical protein